MSTDAGTDILKAVRTMLLADATIAGLVSDRVFSTWGNQEAALPLIRMWIGTAALFEMDGAGSGSETDISLHVFTREAAPIVARQIAAKTRDVLDDADNALGLDGSDVVSFQFTDIIVTQDPDDPLLQMAVVRFTALTTAK